MNVSPGVRRQLRRETGQSCAGRSDGNKQPCIRLATTNQTATGQSINRTTVNGLLLSQSVPGASASVLYDYDELERPTLVTLPISGKIFLPQMFLPS
jgi:hypothetical protein